MEDGCPSCLELGSCRFVDDHIIFGCYVVTELGNGLGKQGCSDIRAGAVWTTS